MNVPAKVPFELLTKEPLLIAMALPIPPSVSPGIGITVSMIVYSGDMCMTVPVESVKLEGINPKATKPYGHGKG